MAAPSVAEKSARLAAFLLENSAGDLARLAEALHRNLAKLGVLLFAKSLRIGAFAESKWRDARRYSVLNVRTTERPPLFPRRSDRQIFKAQQSTLLFRVCASAHGREDTGAHWARRRRLARRWGLQRCLNSGCRCPGSPPPWGGRRPRPWILPRRVLTRYVCSCVCSTNPPCVDRGARRISLFRSLFRDM